MHEGARFKRAGFREGGESFEAGAAHPLHQKGFDAVILMMRRHHDVVAAAKRKVRKRAVAGASGRRFDAFSRVAHLHADRFKSDAARLARLSAMLLPLRRMGRKTVMNVDRADLPRNRLTGVGPKTRENVEHRH